MAMNAEFLRHIEAAQATGNREGEEALRHLHAQFMLYVAHNIVPVLPERSMSPIENILIDGKRLRSLRGVANLTQTELGDLLDYSRAFVGLIEKGEIGIPEAKAKEIADLFSMSLNELLIKDEPSPQRPRLDGVKLKMHLLKRNYKQKLFAVELGVNEQTVSRWVRGETQPSEEHISKICQALGIDVSEMVESQSI